jgi:A/G-specific adenine glycosylase
VFLKKLFQWHKKNYRNFSWRKEKDPFHIIIAEIMLQKTDAKKVEAVYDSFIEKYPNPKSLSNAKVKEIEKYFKKLGIRKRAKRMKIFSRDLICRYEGKVPDDRDELKSLMGVGDYISNAVLCFAYHKDVPLLDTNFIRVLNRIFSIRTLKSRARTDQKLWIILTTMIPKGKGREFNLAILDFAALICKSRKPIHEICPLKDICNYYKINVI